MLAHKSINKGQNREIADTENLIHSQYNPGLKVGKKCNNLHCVYDYLIDKKPTFQKNFNLKRQTD